MLGFSGLAIRIEIANIAVMITCKIAKTFANTFLKKYMKCDLIRNNFLSNPELQGIVGVTYIWGDSK